jgi:hypothetical protein
VECREASVATTRGVTALALEVVEELAEEGSVEIRDHEAGWSTDEALGSEAQEQAERRAVRRDGVWTRLPLPEQPVGEECLHQRREVGGHGALFRGRIARSVAS